MERFNGPYLRNNHGGSNNGDDAFKGLADPAQMMSWLGDASHNFDIPSLELADERLLLSSTQAHAAENSLNNVGAGSNFDSTLGISLVNPSNPLPPSPSPAPW